MTNSTNTSWKEIAAWVNGTMSPADHEKWRPWIIAEVIDEYRHIGLEILREADADPVKKALLDRAHAVGNGIPLTRQYPGMRVLLDRAARKLAAIFSVLNPKGLIPAGCHTRLVRRRHLTTPTRRATRGGTRSKRAKQRPVPWRAPENGPPGR